MAAEAEPSSCHRFAEVPVLREILTCATSNVLPVQHSSIYPSCTPLSSPSGYFPYQHQPSLMMLPPVSWLRTVIPNAIPDFCQEEYFFFNYFFTFLNAILQGRLTTTKNHCRRSVKFKELCSHGRAGVAMEMSDSLRAFVCVCI